MIVRLFHAVDAFTGAIAVITVFVVARCIVIGVVAVWLLRLDMAWFVVGHLSEANRSNVFQFAVMTSMSDHFVGIRAYEITFQTVEM